MQIRTNLLTSVIFLFFLGISCSTPEEKQSTTIHWDTWGVPHISSSNVEELFYAQGYAQMHNHANLILKLYGTARGKGAEYWGESNLPNDMLIHTLRFPELAAAWETKQSQELKSILQSFVDGLNAYASSNPEAIEEKYKVVLPVTVQDVNIHGMYVVFTRFIGGRDLGMTQKWPDMGSNTYAIAPQRSASGNAMLVQNPHLPWSNEFMFFESHLNLNGKNMYGSTLVGFPGIAIGFNEKLGWSHTNNTSKW